MSSSDKQPSKALIVMPLLMLGLGAVLQVHWLVVIGGVGLVGWYIDYSLAPTLRKRWYELLGAIRGQAPSEDEQKHNEEPQQQEEYERVCHEQKLNRQIEAAHEKSPCKHVPGLPWGDPRSYVKASTPEEPERARRESESELCAKCGTFHRYTGGRCPSL